MTTISGTITTVIHGTGIDTCSFSGIQQSPHGNHTVSFTFYAAQGTFTQGQSVTLDIV